MLNGSRTKNAFGACLLVCVSTFVALGLSELFARTILNSVDYLDAYLEDDELLKHTVRPGSSGHDAWGFRNMAVPAATEIVAIGDSQTYGVSAPAKNSWPAALQNLTGKSVYNLSLGGYGPVQYYHLLKSQALKLRPNLVIIGFYFGNDLWDAYDIVYTKDYWGHLRKPGFIVNNEKQRAIDDGVSSQQTKWLGSFRDWLAHHSVFYRMFTLTFGSTLRFFEMKYGYSQANHQINILEKNALNIRTGFTPLARLRGLDLDAPEVREGLRLTLELVGQMNDLCSKEGTEFLVALIPTKESVYADYIGDNGEMKNSATMDRLLANERRVNQLLRKYLDDHSIAYVDLLADLRSAARSKTIYPHSEDGHPNTEGYRVIATAIARFLNEDQNAIGN
jgi:lysophospholipase L1-like esterase